MTTKADYEEVLRDHRRLAREIDIAMHGKDKAAKQASLCALVPLAKRMRTQNIQLRAALAHALEAVTPDDDCPECEEARQLLEQA